MWQKSTKKKLIREQVNKKLKKRIRKLLNKQEMIREIEKRNEETPVEGK